MNLEYTNSSTAELSTCSSVQALDRPTTFSVNVLNDVRGSRVNPFE